MSSLREEFGKCLKMRKVWGVTGLSGTLTSVFYLLTLQDNTAIDQVYTQEPCNQVNVAVCYFSCCVGHWGPQAAWAPWHLRVGDTDAARRCGAGRMGNGSEWVGCGRVC